MQKQKCYNKRMVYIKRKRKIKWVSVLGLFFVLSLVLTYIFKDFIFNPASPNIEVIVEDKTLVLVGPDTNKNGLSDVQDLVLGARKDALAMPTYKSAYYGGGYPPDDEGVCTDLIWRAFLEAGLSLKDLVDEDIAANTKLYPATWGYPDPNIDFRRVANLNVYFKRHYEILTNDVYEVDQWLPGDIVVFGNNEHMGIVSDIRNENDIPFLIHNNGQEDREEDRLEYGSYTMGIVGHYRLISTN